jgi:hypothetical protein
MDRIKVRLWNEASDRMAKISQKFTKESDHFLGEKIIEVRNLGESTDLWHKLGMYVLSLNKSNWQYRQAAILLM